ncbi:MAG: hypothetical protein MJ082_00305 [Clostridia bacterium]|nr:hypothetical protein [Clostridia bacterium]
MKKYALLLLVLTLVVGCLMAFTSCGDKPAPTPDDPTCEHAWNAGEVTTPATCTAAGVKTFTCTKCNETKTEAIGALGHEWDTDFTVDTPATCTAKGSKSIHCAKCNEKKDVTEIDLTGHAWDTDFTVDTPATCAAKGSKSIHCANCNEKKDVTEIDTVGHNYVYTVTKEATLFADGTDHGVCSVCSAVDDKVIPAGSNVDVVTAATSSPFKHNKNYEEILEEGQHFYPTAENPEGNDLFIEFSLLWNDTVKNNANLKTIGIRLWGATGDNNTTIFEFNLKDGISGQWGTAAGSFEPCNCNGKTAAEIYTEASKFKGTSGSGYNDLPNFGEYGWHRVGFQVHQEAELVDGEIKTSALLSVYLDGEMVLQYHMNAAKLIEKGGVLFKTELVDGTIKYSDNTGFGPYIYFEKFGSAADMVFPFADVNFSCGKDFVQKVEKVDAPEAKDFKVSDTVTLPGAMHYAPACDHNIAWNVTKDATMFADGAKTGTCSVCGKEFNEVIPVGSNTVIYSSNEFNEIGKTSFNTPSYLMSDLGHFYPTEENPNVKDLIAEFSILWNNSIENDAFVNNLYLFRFNNPADTNSGTTTVWLHPGIADSCAPKFGAFELNKASKVLVGPQQGGAWKDGEALKKAGVAVDDANFDDYYYVLKGEGWHRIGMRLHEDVTLNGNEVVYKEIFTIYVDGEVVISYECASSMPKLYQAEVVDGNIVFSDAVHYANDSAFVAFQFSNFVGNNNGSYLEDRYIGIADASVSVGTEFAMNVEKVASPVEATVEVAEGVTVPGTMYFQLKTVE